ncbi:RIP metalloprotease RseP [Candidatus Saganbacteria bacterium]|nr:RIP metalloprotease RseP [Candidatus Saganbacteria bacterium]
MLISLISFIIIFTLIALVHEGGHFLMAKKAGMYIPECGIGFGPRIFSFKKSETTYSINLIPILAYVSIAGMDEAGKDSAPILENQKYFSKPPLSRLLMALFGPMMNIFLSVVILAFVFGIYGVPKTLSNVIDQVQPKSAAEKAGLKSGDQIIVFNGKKDIKMEEVIESIHKSDGKQVKFTIKRGNHTFGITATPIYNTKLKVDLLGFTPLPIYSKVNPLEAIFFGFQQTLSMIALMFIILFKLVTGSVALSDLAGPVGIAQITGKYASSGLLALLQFTAFLNVNIGVLNLLPLPALDGGHIVFALIEMVTRKRVSEDLQKKIHQWGLIFLLALMALVTLNDFLRIFRPR